MRTIRIFCDNLSDETSTLDETQSRHLSKVLRLGIGDAVEAFDGRGQTAEAIIQDATQRQVTLHIQKRSHLSPKTAGRVILAVSMAKGERFDWMIEKCTELGVDHIASVQYDRTVKLGKGSVLERFRKITIEASKQCGRAYLPILSGPEKFSTSFALLCKQYPDARLWVGDPAGETIAAGQQSQRHSDKIIFIGPEGGFSDGEALFFQDIKACPVCVNDNVLRIETAAIAFAAVLCCR